MLDVCPAEPSTRHRVLSLVQRHGWNATSFQTLESGYSYLFPRRDSCVAYAATGNAWVAAGAPIAATDALAFNCEAFVSAAREAGKRCCFFATEERLKAAVGARLRTLKIGEQPVWNPADWPGVVAGRRSLREQLRRARAKGVCVRLATTAELEAGPTREAMKLTSQRWLESHGMPAMSFLVRMEPFTFPAHRRCFVAEIDGRVVAFAAVVPVPARRGWLVEDLVREPHAPNGTGELLIDAVMRWAAESNCGWLTLGLAPLAGDISRWLRLARSSAAFLYDFRGLHAYKAKLGPNAWSPIYLSYPPTQTALVSVADALSAFASGEPWSFGVRSLLRRYRA